MEEWEGHFNEVLERVDCRIRKGEERNKRGGEEEKEISREEMDKVIKR